LSATILMFGGRFPYVTLDTNSDPTSTVWWRRRLLCVRTVWRNRDRRNHSHCSRRVASHWADAVLSPPPRRTAKKRWSLLKATVLEQDPVFEQAVIERDLAMRHRMIGLTTRMVHAALFKPGAELADRLGRGVVARQAWFVAARCLIPDFFGLISVDCAVVAFLESDCSTRPRMATFAIILDPSST
jgi:hypothetical protein